MITSNKLINKTVMQANQTMYPSQSTNSLCGAGKFGYTSGQAGDDYFQMLQNTGYIGD